MAGECGLASERFFEKYRFAWKMEKSMHIRKNTPNVLYTNEEKRNCLWDIVEEGPTPMSVDWSIDDVNELSSSDGRNNTAPG
mmetsp:Transcript_27052/g.57908  ORF Transcript_27052/g.57908 Transcript_27052/m.57908 type:complete len:82 (+) Transcript_27052:178-423(+)